MYPIDRRRVATHIYRLLRSLRKAALFLNVSHSTVKRWISCPDRKEYDAEERKATSKTCRVTSFIRTSIESDPFITLRKLRKSVYEFLGVVVSVELVRTVISKIGFSKKKARFFGKPRTQESKTHEFLRLRTRFMMEGRKFFSLDETSFGRHGKSVYGFSVKGRPLYARKKEARVTTSSSLVIVSDTGQIQRQNKYGAFNTMTFLEALKKFDIPPNSVVLLDNVSFHHSRHVREYINERGINLLYVPPYSPWFNPVEGVFSVVKRHYYQFWCVNGAFDAVTTSHIRAFFGKSFSLLRGPELSDACCPN